MISTSGWADLEVFNGETQRDPPTKSRIYSATPAVFIVALAFLLPRQFSLEKPSPALLDWNTVEKRLPWGVILLLGGGFALADATGKTGLSNYIVLQLDGLKVSSEVVTVRLREILAEFGPSPGQLHHRLRLHLPDGGGLQHRLCQHPGAHPLPDVHLPLLQPPHPHDDLRCLCELRIHAPCSHGS